MRKYKKDKEKHEEIHKQEEDENKSYCIVSIPVLCVVQVTSTKDDVSSTTNKAYFLIAETSKPIKLVLNVTVTSHKQRNALSSWLRALASSVNGHGIKSYWTQK
jgi:hypothetical protein